MPLIQAGDWFGLAFKAMISMNQEKKSFSTLSFTSW